MIIDPYTWRKVSVTSKSFVTKYIVSIKFDRPTDYRFKPGQYCIVRIPNQISRTVRQYSFASGPNDDEMELLIQREPNGVASNWFYECHQGDKIEITQAFGNFTIGENTEHLTCFAGKVGIAPFISMMRYYPHIRFSIVYATSSREEMIDLSSIKGKNDIYSVTTSDGKRVTEDFIKTLSKTSTYMLCGSKHFTDSISDLLTGCDIKQEQVLLESFTLQ